MKLYLLRHTRVIDREAGKDFADEDRPLTAKGHQQAQRLALALHQVQIPIDLVLTSPYVCAMQTAETLCEHLDDPSLEIRTLKRLAPGNSSKKLAKHLVGLEVDHVLLVGHEPDLSGHLAWMIGDRNATVRLTKGALACVSFDVAPGQGLGTLQWLITPQWISALLPSPAGDDIDVVPIVRDTPPPDELDISAS